MVYPSHTLSLPLSSRLQFHLLLNASKVPTWWGSSMTNGLGLRSSLSPYTSQTKGRRDPGRSFSDQSTAGDCLLARPKGFKSILPEFPKGKCDLQLNDQSRSFTLVVKERLGRAYYSLFYYSTRSTRRLRSILPVFLKGKCDLRLEDLNRSFILVVKSDPGWSHLPISLPLPKDPSRSSYQSISRQEATKDYWCRGHQETKGLWRAVGTNNPANYSVGKRAGIDLLDVSQAPPGGPIDPWESLLMPCFLFFSSSAPRSTYLGAPVALYRKPFESRPVDSVRQEYVFQMVPQTGASTSSGWFSPTAVPQRHLRPLSPAQECQAGPVPRPKKVRRPH